MIKRLAEGFMRTAAIVSLLLVGVTPSGIAGGEVHILRGIVQMAVGTILFLLFALLAEELE